MNEVNPIASARKALDAYNSATFDIAKVLDTYDAVARMTTFDIAKVLDTYDAVARMTTFDIAKVIDTYDLAAARAVRMPGAVLAEVGSTLTSGVLSEPGTGTTEGPNGLSDTARLAIAGYVGLMLFLVCVALWLRHPRAMGVALDATGPVTWSWVLAAAVYKALRDHDGDE